MEKIIQESDKKIQLRFHPKTLWLWLRNPDAICMRYGWKVKGIPIHCAYGETNFVDHSVICKLGVCTLMRHNSVRVSRHRWGRYVEMFRQNLHFCQSTKTIFEEKSTLLTMQAWIFMQEDCGIAVRKHSLT